MVELQPGDTKTWSISMVGYFRKFLLSNCRSTNSNALAMPPNTIGGNVNPAIFGSIFEAGLEKDARQVLGAHYTYEQDIKKVVGPTITDPWLRRIEAAEALEDYYALLRELRQFRVLDPACGSGNFLPRTFGLPILTY